MGEAAVVNVEHIPVALDAGRLRRRQRQAVVAHVAAENDALAGAAKLVPVEAGQLERAVVRLGAAAREEDRVQVTGQQRGDLGGQLDAGAIGRAAEGGGVLQLAHLLGGDFGQFLAPVADVDVPHASGAVDVLVAIDIVEVDTLATLPDDRTLHAVRVKVRQPVQDVAHIQVGEALSFGLPDNGLHDVPSRRYDEPGSGDRPARLLVEKGEAIPPDSEPHDLTPVVDVFRTDGGHDIVAALHQVLPTGYA